MKHLYKDTSHCKTNQTRCFVAVCLLALAAIVFGSNSQGWTVANVPNPKTQDAGNWISDPDDILSPEAEHQINWMLQKLEDSLSIEIAVVALNSIEGNNPHEFALSLFNTWGVGKSDDDNGLLILLTLDIRDITFKTGYGIEGVLPDILCKRIQKESMLPHLQANDWDTGMVLGIKAVTDTLLGSDYIPPPPESWIKKFCRTTHPLVLNVFGMMLLLINWFVWNSVTDKLTPKNKNAEAALTLLAIHKPLDVKTLLKAIWLIPVWPALFGIALWYWGWQKKKLNKMSRTCPSCKRVCLEPVSENELKGMVSESEQMELDMQTAYIKIYKCTVCRETVKIRIPIEKDGFECCPNCRHMLLHREEKFKTIKKPTTTSEGMMEARHKCLYCHNEYVVSQKIPRISSNSGSSGSSRSLGSSRSGGSFGGGSSGGGGASSRF